VKVKIGKHSDDFSPNINYKHLYTKQNIPTIDELQHYLLNFKTVS